MSIVCPASIPEIDGTLFFKAICLRKQSHTCIQMDLEHLIEIMARSFLASDLLLYDFENRYRCIKYFLSIFTENQPIKSISQPENNQNINCNNKHYRIIVAIKFLKSFSLSNRIM